MPIILSRLPTASAPRYAARTAPGPDARGVVLSGVQMEYRIAYQVLPAGVGADDYEPADLERREDVIDLPAPEDGYGPHIADVKDALRDMLDGAEPIAIRFL